MSEKETTHTDVQEKGQETVTPEKQVGESTASSDSHVDASAKQTEPEEKNNLITDEQKEKLQEVGKDVGDRVRVFGSHFGTSLVHPAISEEAPKRSFGLVNVVLYYVLVFWLYSKERQVLQASTFTWDLLWPLLLLAISYFASIHRPDPRAFVERLGQLLSVQNIIYLLLLGMTFTEGDYAAWYLVLTLGAFFNQWTISVNYIMHDLKKKEWTDSRYYYVLGTMLALVAAFIFLLFRAVTYILTYALW